MVTRTGETFASRVAASILRAAGLERLVAHDAESYHALVLRIAQDPGELAALKGHLEAVRISCRLFDSAA